MNWKFWNKNPQKTVQDDHQQTLTPTTITDGGQKHTVDNIARRLQEGDALNIALTGPYGSGKSSILRTLMQDFPDYKYLPISLATLKSAGEDKDNLDDETITTLNSRIEFSILQQLGYHEKQDTLYNSRFKRIYHKSKTYQFLIAVAVLAYILCLVILFEPSFLRVEWIYNLLNNPTLNIVADVIAIIYLLFATTFAIRKCVKTYGNSKLNKLNLKDASIELGEENSIFNKYMEEIIYFFQATDYNVVIIEDLDRFNNTEIFLKLREVNQLLNNSKAIGRKIFFIYAVRDDMFIDSDRTKFFDYITTVIPIINSSNSIDMIKTEMEKKGLDGLDEDVLEDIAFFIDDMRLLKNIINEYAQYREKLDKKIDQNKLFAMIVYKNYHPKDFADLHKGKGNLFCCLHMKPQLLTERNKQIDAKITELNEKLKCLSQSNELQEKDLRLVYIAAYHKYIRRINNSAFYEFYLNGTAYTFAEMAENESLFNTFVGSNIVQFGYFYYGRLQTASSDIPFSTIEKQVNADFSYAQRLESLRKGEQYYKEQIRVLELSRNNHYSTPIKDLLSGVDMGNNPLFEGAEISKLLEHFLKTGLIDENYFDYISYFFGKSLNQHDHDFVLEIKLGHVLDYEYPLDKVEQCVKNIPEQCYSQPNILNIQLVDYICQNLGEESNASKLHAIAQAIKLNKKWDFLIKYYDAVEDAQPLFSHLAKLWEGFWKVLNKQKSNSLYEAWLRYLEFDYSTNDSKKWIGNNYSFISQRIENISLDTITQIIEHTGIVFSVLDSQSEELLEYVAQNNVYDLTAPNVAHVLVHLRKERTESYDTYPLNLTAVRSTPNADKLIEYVDENINDVLTKVFNTDAAKKEAKEIIAELLDSESITEEIKREYLSNQAAKISLSMIKEVNWPLAIEIDCVFPCWADIYTFYESQGNSVSDILWAYISKHIKDLDDITLLSKTQSETMSQELLLSSKLSIPVYDAVIKLFPDAKFIDTDMSEVDNAHITYLIKNDRMPYSSWYITHLKGTKPEAIPIYVAKYIGESIADIAILPTDMPLFKQMLRDNRVTVDNDITICEHFLPHAIMDKELANLLVPIMRTRNNDFNLEAKVNVLSIADNGQDKLNLLITSINNHRNDISEIDELLEAMEDPYNSIADKSHRATISITDTHRTLLKTLEAIGYISSISEKDDKFRVNHKRNY